jgi:hypothetical protein
MFASQILCGALNGVRLPSFPNHSVAVKYSKNEFIWLILFFPDHDSDMRRSTVVVYVSVDLASAIASPASYPYCFACPLLLKIVRSGTDPLKDNLPLVICAPTSLPSGENYSAAVMTAKLVSELSDVMQSVLEQHHINAMRAKDGLPLANVVLLR